MVQICEAGRDPCGCDQWKKGIRTINNQYPDDNRDFDINAGDGIEITPATAGITIAVKTPFPGPMIFRGTVGTGGTIASLPVANANNLGWMYVAITAGSTPDDTPKSYEIGDMVVSNGAEWIVIPSGDDPVDWSQIQNTPTTLSGYGITDAVNTTGDQTGISGNKTFTNPITVDTTSSNAFRQKNSNLPANRATFGSTYIDIAYLNLTNANGDSFGQIEYVEDTALRAIGLRFYSPTDNTWKGIFVQDRNGATYATAPTRTYNSANTGDIVTIGSLASNPSVIHATGNETKSGILTLNNPLYMSSSKTTISKSTSTDTNSMIITSISPNGTYETRLYLNAKDDGTLQLVLGKWVNGGYVTQTVVATV